MRACNRLREVAWEVNVPHSYEGLDEVGLFLFEQKALGIDLTDHVEDAFQVRQQGIGNLIADVDESLGGPSAGCRGVERQVVDRGSALLFWRSERDQLQQLNMRRMIVV
jgi:hypothetical protein